MAKDKAVQIEVCEGDTFYKVDIKEATQSERFDYYNKISKGQIIRILEAVGNFDKKTGGQI